MYAEKHGAGTIAAGDRIVFDESDIMQLARDLFSASTNLFSAVVGAYTDQK